MVRSGKRRKLGLWMATSLVIGNVIGSGVFLLPAALAPYGSLGLLGWILTGVGALFLGIVFARLSHMMPRVGGPYAFSRRALGDFIGFQVAWSYWIAVWVSTAALVIAAVSYLSVLFPILHVPVWGTCTAIGILWLFTLLNTLGAYTVGMVQILATVLKILPLLLVGGFGWFFINPEHFFPINLSGQPPLSVISATAALTLFTFIGIESATIPEEDIENPEVTVPRATILGTSLCVILYILCAGALIGIVAPEILRASDAPFVDALQKMFPTIYGKWVTIFVVMSALISCLGAANGWVLLQAQVPYAAAQDGLFPSIFKRRSRKNVPYVGLFLSSVLMTILLLMNMQEKLVQQFHRIILLSTFIILVPYVYSSFSEFIILLKTSQFKERKKVFISGVVALFAFSYSIFAVMGIGKEIIFVGGLFLFASIPVYTWVFWQKKTRLHPLEQEASHAKQPTP